MKNPRVRIARLGHDQVYWGLSEEMACGAVKAGDLVFGEPEVVPALPQGAVYVDRGCDLPHGVQRWNPSERRFEPLQRGAAPLVRAAFYLWMENIIFNERGAHKGGR